MKKTFNISNMNTNSNRKKIGDIYILIQNFQQTEL